MQPSGVVFVPFADEPESVPFSAVWSPFNQSATLLNLLDLAERMGRSAVSAPAAKTWQDGAAGLGDWE